MGTERSRLLILGALVLVLSVVLYRTWTDATAGAPAPVVAASAKALPPGRAGGPATPAAAAPSTPDVHLRALDDQRPQPAATDRNLFRFRTKAAPPAPVRVAPPVIPRPVPTAPPGPPPPPPIPLRFIGIVEAPQRARLAALIDTTGRPYHGAEGDVIAGQYRIVKIGVESIEMVYLDGRGRQTIRLNGS